MNKSVDSSDKYYIHHNNIKEYLYINQYYYSLY